MSLDFINLRSLTTQMILSFIAVVILTAITVGFPALLLIRGQLDRQAWAQVDQGRLVAKALYDATQTEIKGLATLTSQRPTLHELLKMGDAAILAEYLRTLQTGTGLDLVVVCNIDRNVTATTETLVSVEACKSWLSGGFQVFPTANINQAWLTASSPIEAKDSVGSYVLVGIKLDDEFARQVSAQTGLEHTILVNDQPVATSFLEGLSRLEDASQQLASPSGAGEDVFCKFELNGIPYYCSQIPFDETNIAASVSLDVKDIRAAQTRLVLTLGGSILIVAVIVSVLGVFLARHISRPLVGLSEAAGELQKGDLDSPVDVQASVHEIAQVAQALESARLDLRRSMTQLHQEKAWVDHLLQSIVEGIVTLDHQGRITYFSKGAEHITGWDREQVLHRSCDDVFRLVEARDAFSAWIPAPGAKEKLVIKLAEGRQATLSVTGARLAPSEVSDAEVVLVFRDVSEEEMIHRLLGHFLANVAHEFRTPLSSLAASIELLLDQAPDLSAEELQELLVSLHLSTLSLQTLVDNLLEGASIEAGHFRVSPKRSDLGRIIAEAAGTMQPLLEKYGQRLNIALPKTVPRVTADERRTVQVLINLLANASKYGPAGGEISIRVDVVQDWVRVGVADQGPGIPAEYREDIFRRFTYPGSLSESARAGVGLGLSVVKAVIEAHGGQVGVEDRPGGGAIFWFTLQMVNEL